MRCCCAGTRGAAGDGADQQSYGSGLRRVPPVHRTSHRQRRRAPQASDCSDSSGSERPRHGADRALQTAATRRKQQEKKAHTYDKRPTYLRAAEMREAEREQRREHTGRRNKRSQPRVRERQRDRETDRDRDRETQRDRELQRDRQRPFSRLPEGQPGAGGRRHHAAKGDAERRRETQRGAERRRETQGDTESAVEPHRMRHRTLELMAAAEARGGTLSSQN